MKVRKSSVTLKLIIAVVLLFLVSDVILAFVTYNKCSKILSDQIKSDTENIAKSVAEMIDGSIVASVKPGDENTDDYLKVSNMLTTFLDATGMEYIYTVRPAADGSMEYAIDAQIEDYSAIGDVFDDEEAAPALSGSVVSSSEPYTDDWGRHISSYAPVYDGDKITGAVGVDVNMEWVEAQMAALLRAIIMVAVIIVIISAVLLIVLGKTLSQKFVMLNDKIVDLQRVTVI